MHVHDNSRYGGQSLGRPTKEKTGIKDLEILKRLVLNGPLNCYEMSVENQKIVITYPTVWRRVKTDKDSLLNTGMVSEVESTKPVKYNLTTQGLLRVLSRYPKNLQGHMDDIVDRWSSLLPPPFQKWSYLKAKGLENQMIEILRGLGWVFPRLARDRYLGYVVRAVFFHILFGGGASKDTLAWYKALRDDPELKEWAIDNLRRDIDAIRDWGKIYEQVLKMIEASKEPNLDDLKAVLKIPVVPSIVIMPLLAAQITRS